MTENIIIFMFADLIIRFSWIWDSYVWLIHKNLKGIIIFLILSLDLKTQHQIFLLLISSKYIIMKKL